MVNNDDEQPLCVVCRQPTTDTETTTTCRRCFRSFHLVCVGLTKKSTQYGCTRCYRIAGNAPQGRFDSPPPKTIFPLSSGLQTASSTMVELNPPLATTSRPNEDELLQLMRQQSTLMERLLEHRTSSRASSQGSARGERVVTPPGYRICAEGEWRLNFQRYTRPLVQ